MNLELGTTGGRYPDGPAASRRRARSSIADVAVIALAVVVAMAVMAAFLPGPRQTGEPDRAAMVGPSASASMADTADPDASAPLLAIPVPDLEPDPEPDSERTLPTALDFRGPLLPADAPGRDPDDLPRFPGSRRTSYAEERIGRVHSVSLEYLAADPADAVRAYYREALREHGWFVGDVDVDLGSWRFDANRGTREVTLGIAPAGEAPGASTRVSLSVSDVIPRATPQPTPRATPTRAPRHRDQEADRPRERARADRRDDGRDERRRPGRRDDDDDGDDDDDDDDDSADSDD